MLALRPVLEALGLALALTAPVIILSYCAHRADLPLADNRLLMMDHRLSLDVEPLVRVVGRHRALAGLFDAAYASFIPQLILLPLGLAWSGRADRAYRMVTGFVGVSLVCIGVSVFYPSLGTFKALAFDGTVTGYIDAAPGTAFLTSFAAVRSAPEFALSFGMASGIVTFPSMHAGMAVLCAWAAAPLGRIGRAVAALNAVMFLSAITHGAHYAVDLLAGGAVAIVVVGLVRASERRATGSRLSARRGAPAAAGAARSA